MAGAIAALLALVVSVLVLAGMLATPLFIDVIAPGFHGDTRALTIDIVRVLFPGTGLLVLSAWCLGVLNSHRRFLLSYASGVMWNVAMIATLLLFGGRTSLPTLAVYLGWGSVVGSALQFGVQLPFVLRLAPDLRIAFDTRLRRRAHRRAELRAGVRQPRRRAAQRVHRHAAGHLAARRRRRRPVERDDADAVAGEPVRDGGVGGRTAGDVGRGERRTGMARRPSACGSMPGFDGSRFSWCRRRWRFWRSAMSWPARSCRPDASSARTREYVWAILAGSAVGLLAQTLGRLYSSTYYALRDTRTPLRYAVLRVALTTVLGYACAFWLPGPLGIAPRWGAAGLTASAGVAGWVEMLLLRRTMNARIGRTGLPVSYAAKLWMSAIAGAAVAWGIKLALPSLHPVVAAIAVLGPFGLVYFGMTLALGLPEAVVRSVRLQADVRLKPDATGTCATARG